MKIVLQKDGKTGKGASYFVIGMVLFVALSVSFASFGKIRHNDHTSVFVDNSLRLFPKVKETQGVYQLFSHGRPGELLINGEWKNAQKIVDFLIGNYEGLASQLGFTNDDLRMTNEERTLITAAAAAHHPSLITHHHSPTTHHRSGGRSPLTHLNIYGCNFAQGEKGLEAVAYLEKTLGISVAASDDITGRDGDWTLEVGKPVGAIAVAGYDGNLQTTPPMNLYQFTDKYYNICLKLGFTSKCYATTGGRGDDIAINADGVIALDGTFTYYNYMNSTGSITTNAAPMYGFLNSDFTFNSSFMPAYVAALDDTTQSSPCVLTSVKQFMSSTKDSCFIYNLYSGGSNRIYKVCAGGVRTLLYTPAAINITTLATSKLGDYFFSAERAGTNGPYVIKKVSTITGAVLSFNYSNSAASSQVSQIVEAPDGKIYIIEGPNSTLKRLNSTGAVDATFTSHSGVASFALQSTGKVIAGGVYTNTTSLTRYNTDGSVDATFNTLTDVFGKAYTGAGPYTITATRGAINKIQINANDEIYFIGSFNEVNGYYSNGLGKLSANGVYDNTFRLNLKGGARAAGGVNDILLQPDGKLLVATHFGEFGWASLFQTGLIRLLPNGKLDTPINNTATNLDAKVPTAKDLLISLQTMGGANSPVIAYNFDDVANFNKPGYNANPSLNADTLSGTHGVSELEYSLANKMYYKASGNLLTAFKTTDASITGKADIAWSVILPTPTNGYFVYDLQVSADGKYLAVNQGGFDGAIYDAKTGALLNGTLNSGGWSMAYQPIPPYNLFMLKLSGNNTLSSVTKYNSIGASPVSIGLQSAPYLGVSTQTKIVFYSPVDFYILDERWIYKYKLVTSSTNSTPNPSGNYAILDTGFGVSGKWDLGTTSPAWQANPQYDALTVGPDGTIYIKGAFTRCDGEGGGNVATIAPVGKSIDLNFIQMVSVNNTASNGFSTTQTAGWYNFALGQTGTCSTAPDVTPTDASNTCPATTVSLGTLATTSTLPSGSTLVWSTHKVPTGSSDTLTNLNVSTSGKYYALYYDKTYNCFGPADSVTVTITSPCPVCGGTLPTDDYDCDGVVNSVDLDDDNDGVLDTVEGACSTTFSPSYITNANIIVTPSTLVALNDTDVNPVTDLSQNYANFTSTDKIATFTFTTPQTLSKIITYNSWGLRDVQAYKWVYRFYDASNNLLATSPMQYDSTWYPANPQSIPYTFSAIANVKSVQMEVLQYSVDRVVTPPQIHNMSDGGAYQNFVEVREVDFFTGCKDLDTDNDGIPNYLDTDSDNDGCTDAYEAGTSTTNVATVPAPYGANGFADSKETSPESGVYNGTYTYSNATNATIKTCPTCGAGTTAPTLNATTKTNVCPAITADLTGLVTSTCPGTSTLQWHNTNTGLNQTTTWVTNSMQVPAGTYYPVCYDNAGGCYSPTPSPGVTVTIVDCCAAGTVAPVIQKN